MFSYESKIANNEVFDECAINLPWIYTCVSTAFYNKTNCWVERCLLLNIPILRKEETFLKGSNLYRQIFEKKFFANFCRKDPSRVILMREIDCARTPEAWKCFSGLHPWNTWSINVYNYIDFTVLKTKLFTDEGQGSIFKLRKCMQSIFLIKIILERSFLHLERSFFFSTKICEKIVLNILSIFSIFFEFFQFFFELFKFFLFSIFCQSRQLQLSRKLFSEIFFK